MSLCSSGMPLALGPWKRTTAIDIAIELARLEGFLQFGLVMEDAHRRFDDETVGGNRRRLDDGAAELAFEHCKPPVAWKGMGAIAQNSSSSPLCFAASCQAR